MNDILERLLQGNRRFALGQTRGADISIARRHQVSNVQQPFAMILGCADSRVPPEIVFDCGLGDLFVIRTAGHTIDEVVRASILFGVKALKIPLVLVLGHTRCGAVSLAITRRRQPTLDDDTACIAEQIAPAIEQCENEGLALDCVVKAHVRMTVARLENLIRPVSQDVDIRGAYYDLNTGLVEVL
ncbi:MAG: carbonic anhydrase [Anaerolineae bacterium]|nr:carbonic anhydrase [Anaerolineae bacterium]